MSARAFTLPKASQNASDLIIELKELNVRLQELEQEEDEGLAAGLRERLAPIPAGLLEAKWMLHRDKTVRLMVACCLAQILRLYAPDPPFTGEPLSRVFSLFVQQLRGMSEPNGTYYSHYFGLLESLATVKSIVLVWEVQEGDGRDAILTDLFKTSLALVHPKMERPVRIYLLELLDAVIGECPGTGSLPEDALGMLLAGIGNALEPHLSAFIGELMQQSSERMAGILSGHFNELLISHASSPAMERIRAVHSQLASVSRHSVDCLALVMTQLAQELTLDESEMRTLAIQTLGAIFGSSRQGRQFGATWTAWLGRRSDKSTGIRAHWISHAARLLPKLGDPASIEELAAALGDKLLDPEERVRERVLLDLGNVENLEALPKTLLEQVASRCLDRKEDVRVPALSLLCALLSRLDIADGDFALEIESRKRAWSFLPNALLKLMYTDDRDCRILCEYYLEHSVLTSPGLSVKEQALRWAWMWTSLDDAGRQAFAVWIRLKGQFVKLMQAFLHCAAIPEMAESHRLLGIVQHLSERFRAPLPAQSCLGAVVRSDEIRQVLALLVNPETSVASARKAIESVAKIQLLDAKIKLYLLQFMANRASWVSVSRELISELLALSTGTNAIPALLDLLLAELPTLAGNHGDYLLKGCLASGFDAASLKSMYHFVKSTGSPVDDALVAALEEIVDTSESRRQVKFAARLLLTRGDPSGLCESSATDTAHPNGLVKMRAWQVLAVMAQEKPALLPPYLEELLLEYEVILADLPCISGDLLGVSTKFWANALPRIGTSLAKTAAGTAYAEELLRIILGATGKANVALEGSLLKSLLLIIGPSVPLSFFLEKQLVDPIGRCDEAMVKKLGHLVACHKISPLVLMIITAELGKDHYGRFKPLLQQSLQLWSRNATATGREEDEHLVDSADVGHAEDLLVSLLMLLARQERLDDGRAKAILCLFFDAILSGENLSYLFTLAVEVKRYHAIASSPSVRLHDKPLYLGSEMAQSILRQRAALMHVSLEAFPLPIRLSDSLLAPLDPALATLNLTRSYLASLQAKQQSKRLFGKRPPKPTKADSGTASPQRRNPGRGAKLPAGTLDLLLSQASDSEGDDLMSDEVEESDGENRPDNQIPATDSKGKRVRQEPSEFSIEL